jgi:hypothetical protein
MREPLNQVRGYHFLLGVFRNQLKDPYCGVCSAYANTLKAAREGLAAFEASDADAVGAMAPQFAGMLAETRAGLASLPSPADPSGQKKAGNCKLPQGVCFIKASFSLLQQV